MEKIIANKNLVLNHFDDATTKWENNLEIELFTDIEEKELDSVISKLVDTLPNPLAYAVLSDLAEKEDLPIKFLRLIYEKGDIGCKVTICLRDNLPHDIANLCESSDDIDVREHYLQKKKCSPKGDKVQERLQE